MKDYSQNDEPTRHATAKPAPQADSVQVWHALSFEAVKDRLKTDMSRGLTQSEAASPGTRALDFGHLLAQFRSLIVALLVVNDAPALKMADIGIAMGIKGTRSPRRRSAFTSRLFTNRWLWAAVVLFLLLQAAAVYLPLLRKVLHTVPPTISDWALIAACSVMPVAVVELIKVMTLWVHIQGVGRAKSD